MAPEQVYQNKELINPSRFHGIIVPTLTPFVQHPLNESLVVDIKSQDKNIERLINAGCHAIFLGSYAGEGRFMDMLNWKCSIQAGAQKIYSLGHNVPIIVGVLRENIEEVVEGSKFAQKNGADAIVFPPLLGGVPDNIEHRLSLVKQATNLPIILYNNPRDFGGDNLPRDFIEQIAEDHQIVGIKDSSGNMTPPNDYFDFLISIMRGNPHFYVFQGSTKKGLYGLSEGAKGMVPREAEIDPQLLVNFFNNPLRTDEDQAKIDEVRSKIHAGGGNQYIKQELVKFGIFRSSLMYPLSKEK